MNIRKVVLPPEHHFQFTRWVRFVASWIVLPGMIAVIGFLYGLVNYTGASFFTINHYHSQPDTLSPLVPLTNHSVVRFNIVSQKDNLGTIAIKLKLPEDDIEGNITFRLFETDTGKQVFIGNYNMLVLYGDKFYPLGFPTIEHSKNARYTVQLETTYVKGKGIRLNFENVAFITKYHVDKIDPIKKPKEFAMYFRNKLANLVMDNEFYAHILLYLVPVVLYYIWKIMNDKYVTAILLMVIGYRIYYYVYIPLHERAYEAELYIKLATLLFVIIKYNIRGNVYFIVSLFMYLLSIIYVGLHQDEVAVGYATWTYYFMVLGFCAFIWEYYGATMVKMITNTISKMRKVFGYIQVLG